MRVVTAAEMREADRRCIEIIGIPGAVLMNNAGHEAFMELNRGPVGVVCGKGNNGGDGLVVARMALLVDYDPTVILVGQPEEVKGDAATFMQAYLNLGGRLVVAPSEEEAAAAVAGLEHQATIVDALLGTGITGEVHGPIRAAIDAWPRVRTVSVDLPSGMNADTGEPCGCCVRADVTVTFQFMKTGLRYPAAQEYVGRLRVADIGIPEVCADDEAWMRLQGTD